ATVWWPAPDATCGPFPRSRSTGLGNPEGDEGLTAVASSTPAQTGEAGVLGRTRSGFRNINSRPRSACNDASSSWGSPVTTGSFTSIPSGGSTASMGLDQGELVGSFG